MSCTTIKNTHSDKKMSDTERAYIAGLFDGEGTISLNVWKREENVFGFRLGPNVCIYNSDLELLMHCREYMGNGAVILHNENRTDKQKPMYRLALQANQVRHVLPQLMEFLYGKKRQAELVLQYLELCPSGPNNSHLFDDFVEILSELRSLNKRGPGSVSRDEIRNRLTSIKEARSSS